MGIKLVILGMLMEGNKHPYEIQQLVKERQMEHYIKLAKGSLYYAFEVLEKEGYIQKDAVVTDTNRPDKTIYRITSSGINHFNKLLLKEINVKHHMGKPIYTTLSFAALGDHQDIGNELQKKITETKMMHTIMKRVYETNYKVENLANVYILVSVILHLETELKWLNKLYEDTSKNRLHELGIPLLETFKNEKFEKKTT